MARRTLGDVEDIVRIVAAAGGEFPGGMRLHKTVYLLEMAGLGSGYPFRYELYSPFSEQLDLAMEDAPALYPIRKETRPTDWGGTYLVFRSDVPFDGDDAFRDLVRVAKEAGIIELELMSVAAYYGRIGDPDPWKAVKKMRPERAINGWFRNAKSLYQKFKELSLPTPLPDF